MKRRVVLLLVLICLCLYQGCLVLGRYEVSRPRWADSSAPPKGIFKMRELKVSLRAYNFQRTELAVTGYLIPERFEDAAEKVFFIEVGFAPIEEDGLFDPQEVTLNVGDREIKPTSFYGPVSKREPFLHGFFFFEEFKEFYWKSEELTEQEIDYGPVSLEPGKWTGVLLRFEMFPPSPHEEFSLSLDSVEVYGESLDIPEFYFRKGKMLIIDDAI